MNVKKEESSGVLSKIYPDEGQLDYAYDALNRLASTTWTREVSAGTRLKATRAYAEKTGELVSVSYNDGTPGETHVYNHLGQLTQSVDASGTRVYVYNNIRTSTGTRQSPAMNGENASSFCPKAREHSFAYFNF
ncbi:MAG: hypothetical protein IJN19_04675 [Opitutales bacterium]|nr:hypothetical protein [Opitutales bacterium]